MSSRTPNQDKALGWWCQTEGLVPQLSAHPTYFFTTKSGKTVTYDINNIKRAWLKWRDEQLVKMGAKK